MISNGFVVCVAMLLNGGYCSTGCSLPKLKNDINFDMLPGRWYQILSTGDPDESFIPCYILANIHSDEIGGAYYEIKAVTNATRTSETYASIPQHWQLYQEEVYLLDAKYEYIFTDAIASLSKQKNARTGKITLEEINDFYHEPFTFLTDYENYFIEMVCDKDIKSVWVNGRNKHVTGADVKLVRKALAQVGGGWENVPLYRAGCNNFQFVNHSVN